MCTACGLNDGSVRSVSDNRLTQLNEEYEEIMRSPEGEARDRAPSYLTTKMEKEYQIPTMQNMEWEQNDRPVVALYRKISMSRTTV